MKNQREIWSITEAALDRYAAAFAARKPEAFFCFDPPPMPPSLEYEVLNGVAVIPVHGTILKNPDEWDMDAGAFDVDRLPELLEQAAEDQMVSAVLLDIDSPGGVVTGVPEAAQAVADCPLPVIAHTSGDMCSAAYWIGSQSAAVYATPSADVGSIGVLQAFFDLTGYYAQLGVKVDILKTGPYKAAGYPGTSLTDEQRAQFEAQINEIYEMFTAAVQSRRQSVQADAMQGQTFLGNSAARAGLVDSVAGFETALADAQRLAGM